MSLSEASQAYARRALRRAVRFECELLSDHWDDGVPHAVTDLSPLGLWIATPLPLETGEEVLVSFTPPRGPRRRDLILVGEVVRAVLRRRRSDDEPTGMGVEFRGMLPHERAVLHACLFGLPPPLPRRRTSPPPLPSRRPPPLPRRVASELSARDARALPQALIFGDSPEETSLEGFDLRAEAGLINAPRRVASAL